MLCQPVCKKRGFSFKILVIKLTSIDITSYKEEAQHGYYKKKWKGFLRAGNSSETHVKTLSDEMTVKATTKQL